MEMVLGERSGGFFIIVIWRGESVMVMKISRDLRTSLSIASV